MIKGELEHHMMLLSRRIDDLQASPDAGRFEEVINDLRARLTRARQVLNDRFLHIQYSEVSTDLLGLF